MVVISDVHYHTEFISTTFLFHRYDYSLIEMLTDHQFQGQVRPTQIYLKGVEVYLSSTFNMHVQYFLLEHTNPPQGALWPPSDYTLYFQPVYSSIS